MKSKLSIIAFVLLTIVSCTKDDSVYENVPQKTQDTEIIHIKAQIAELGEKYNFTNTLESRGFWSSLWGYTKAIFGADARGALKGGLFSKFARAMGAADSVGKLIDIICGKDNQVTSATSTRLFGFPDDNPGNGPIEYPIYINDGHNKIDDVVICEEDSSGYYHNLIITDFFDKNPRLLDGDSIDINIVAVELTSSIEDICGLTKGTLTRDKSFVSEMHDRIINSKNHEYNEESNDPELNETISVIEAYLKTLPENVTESKVKSYSEEVIRIINESSMSENKKSELKTAISVAFASSQLWNVSKLK